MKYTTLNNTDIEVSALALGTATFGGELDESVSFDILSKFFENGGNLIDTAIMYGDWIVEKGESGISEKTIGKWIKEKGNRHSVVISTKGAHPFYKTMHIPRLSENEIISDCEKSLKNLQTDYIDIYFLHRDDVNRPAGEIMQTLNKLVKSGKTRCVGLSNWTPKRIREALEYCEAHNIVKPVISQIQFGIGCPNPDKIDPTTEYMSRESFDFYKDSDLSVLAFSSQSGGYYFALDAGREPNPAYDNPANRELYVQMKKLSEKYGCSVSNVMLGALCQNKYFKTVPIIGVTSIKHLNEAMSDIDICFEESDISDLILKR